jgi:hypothetical protein
MSIDGIHDTIVLITLALSPEPLNARVASSVISTQNTGPVCEVIFQVQVQFLMSQILTYKGNTKIV